MARLTWKNVAAPNFNTAVNAMNVAGNQFSKGFSGIGDAASGYRDDIQKQASNAAMLEAAKINDPAAWDAAMANGGQAGLNIAPGYANDDLVQFANERRGTLVDNQNTQARTAFTGTQNANAIQDQAFEVEDRDYRDAQRQLTADVVARDKEEFETVSSMFDSSYNAEERARAIRDNPNLSEAEQSRYLAIAAGLGEDGFKADSSIISATANTDEVMLATSLIDNRATELNMQTSSNKLLATFNRAYATGEASSDPIGSVLKGIRAEMDGDDNLNRNGAGDIQEFYSAMVEKYPTVGGDLIAQLIKDTKEGTSWFRKNELQIDKGAIEVDLLTFSDPEQVALLQSQSANIKRTNSAISADREKLAAAQQRYNRATQKGDQSEKDKQWKIIQKLAGIGPETLGGGNGSGDGNEDPPTTTPPPTGNPIVLPPELQGNLLPPQSAEQRVSQTNQNLRAFGGNVGDGANAIKTIADRLIGQPVGLFNRALGAAGQGANALAGLVAPEFAAGNIATLDKWNAGANDLLNKGITGTSGKAPAAEPASVPAAVPSSILTKAPEPQNVTAFDDRAPRPGQNAETISRNNSAAMDWATSNPSDAMDIIGDEIGIPDNEVQAAKTIIEALRNGQGTGQEREQLKDVVKRFIDAARAKAKASGERLDPDVASLLDPNAKWLR